MKHHTVFPPTSIELARKLADLKIKQTTLIDLLRRVQHIEEEIERLKNKGRVILDETGETSNEAD